MAFLLPLINELLPIITPSAVHVARSQTLRTVPDLAELPPGNDQRNPFDSRRGSFENGTKAESDSSEQSSHGAPIELFDREEGPPDISQGHDDVMPDPVPKTATVTADETPVPTHSRPQPQVFRKNAIIGMTSKMCASVLIVKPDSATTIHHHGEEDAIMYMSSGSGTLLVHPSLEIQRPTTPGAGVPIKHELAVGDFVLVPAWTEHQLVNGSNPAADAVWIIFQSGSEPIHADMTAWGGSQIEEDSD